MSKLSKREVDAIVEKVMEGIKTIEDNKSKELFENSNNKEAFLNKIKEIEELEDKLNNLKDEIQELKNSFKEEGLKVYYRGRYNGLSLLSRGGELIEMELQNAKGGNLSLQWKVEKELILQGINNKIDINTIIGELIEKYK